MRSEHAEFSEQRGASDRCGVFRFSVLKGDRTIAHDQNPIGERDRLVDIVRHEKHTGPMIGDELSDKVVHANARQRVERCERFIEQQKLWLLHQRAGKCHALRLSAREIPWPVVEPVAEPDFGESGGRAFACVRQSKAK